MKPVKSSSFGAAPILSPIEVRPQDLARDEATVSFSAAINALSMARRYLIEGDELAAEQKATAAVRALRRLLGASAAQSPLSH